MRVSRLISTIFIASFAALTAPSLAQEPVDAEMVDPAVAPEEASAEASGDEAHNAVTAQQNANTILQATTTQGVGLLVSEDSSADTGTVADPE